jgi:hypothetical protein
MLGRPSQTRRWSRLKPNCYGRRQKKTTTTKKLGKNRGMPRPKVFIIEPVCSWWQGDTFGSLALLDVAMALLKRNTSASRQWVVALAQQTWRGRRNFSREGWWQATWDNVPSLNVFLFWWLPLLETCILKLDTWNLLLDTCYLKLVNWNLLL